MPHALKLKQKSTRILSPSVCLSPFPAPPRSPPSFPTTGPAVWFLPFACNKMVLFSFIYYLQPYSLQMHAFPALSTLQTYVYLIFSQSLSLTLTHPYLYES